MNKPLQLFEGQQLGLRAGFLSATVFPLVMLVGVIVLTESGKRKNDKKQRITEKSKRNIP